LQRVENKDGLHILPERKDVADKMDGLLLHDRCQHVSGDLFVWYKLAIRFSPALAAQAQPIVTSIQNVEGLKRLQRALLFAPDEQTVRLLLKLPAQPDLL
jgi:hypothetical protein